MDAIQDSSAIDQVDAALRALAEKAEAYSARQAYEEEVERLRDLYKREARIARRYAWTMRFFTVLFLGLAIWLTIQAAS